MYYWWQWSVRTAAHTAKCGQGDMSLVVTPLICSGINLVMMGQFPVSLNQEEKQKTCKNKLKPFWGGVESDGQELQWECSHAFSSFSCCVYLLLIFSFSPFYEWSCTFSAVEFSEHFKPWWRLTGFYGMLWSCRLQLWGEDSLSSPAVSFVWALGIVGKEEEKQ